MVRRYVKRSKNNTYESETIVKALQALKSSRKTIAKVAKEYNIRAGSLWYHWRNYNNKENFDFETLEKKRFVLRIFSRALEDELLAHVIGCVEVYTTLSPAWIRRFAYELAVENKLEIPRNWKTEKTAGKDWLLNFRQRHKSALTRRHGKSASVEEAIKAHRNATIEFEGNYARVLAKHRFQPKDVFVLEQCKLEDYCVTGEVPGGKSLITFVGTISAMGQSIPPYYIFSFARYHNHRLLQEAPKWSKATSDPSGTMTSEIFVDYLKHVVDSVRCSVEEPVLILLDDDGYHVSLAAVKYARENGVVVMTFPPRTIDKLRHLEHRMFAKITDAED